jgi:hypothetical protein
MTIGSKTLGTAPVAGALGVISPARTVATIQQTVAFRAIEPAQRLVTLEQTIAGIEPARRLVNIQQRIINATAPKPKVPSAYIWIGGDIKAGLKGTQISWTTALNTVRVTHNEDQSATAEIFVFQPVNAPINIPSFHGKQLIIETHIDPTDITSEIIPLFTGWIETARHDRARRGIAIQATDLRSERLSRAYDSGNAPAWAEYSKHVQGEPEKKNLWSTYLESYTGNLGYTRAGELNRWGWDVRGNAPTLTLTDADVSYQDITTEFMTRSSVINEMTIEGKYRWSKLWTISTSLDAYNPRNPSGRAFARNVLLQKVESLQGWDLKTYTFYNLERSNCGFVGGKGICIDLLWTIYGRKKYSQGIRAGLVRRVAQPMSEEYETTIRAPESLAAYGETINGGTISFAVDNNYDGSYWEEGIRDRANFNPESVYTATYQARADALRSELSGAFDAAYAMARRKIVASHRQNYASCVLHRIQPLEIGDVVQHSNRILDVKGQVVGLSYTIADGVRDTEIKIAFCYLDTDTQTSTYLPKPTRPYAGFTYKTVSTSAVYNSGSAVFDITIADIPESVTDEAVLKATSNGTVAVHKTDVTLINGY